MDWNRFTIHILIVGGAIGLTGLVAMRPDAMSEDAMGLVTHGVVALWTLVGVIVRDTRNRTNKD